MLPTADYFDALIQLGVLRQFKAGAFILKQDDPGNAMYLLRKGEVRSLSQALNGKEIVHNIIQAGQYFGEMALDGGARSSSVQAVTDCECCVVPNEQVLAFAAQNSKFALDLLVTAIGRARRATEAARDMALLDVYSRLAPVLNKTFEVHNGVCHLTHAQIASQIGSSREMVSKLIKDLVRGGYVSIERRAVQKIKKLPVNW
jgi:CRP/FNR family cyclic AMP-dependent transcriptional regulator